MKTIIGKCPGLVDFFGYKNDQVFAYSDTANIYDYLELYGKKMIDHHPINVNDDNPLVVKTIKTFLEYTGIKEYKIFANFIKNIPSGLKGDISDALGTLLALDLYFKTNLKDEDIKIIGTLISECLLPYLSLLKREENVLNGRYNLLVIPENGKKIITLNRLKEELEQYKAQLIGINDDNSIVFSFDNYHERYALISKLKATEKVKTHAFTNAPGFILTTNYR